VNIAPMWEIADEQWDDVVDVNLNGMWHAVKAVAPPMIHQRSGAIVLISPANGIEPGKRFAHCTAARHGVLGLMKAAALELAPCDIRCNAVCPGGTDTAQNSWIPRSRSPTRLRGLSVTRRAT
jgi:NAD(P)-dependent dehydrogenase (short-subunit alcohol dehydrogenase family)